MQEDEHKFNFTLAHELGHLSLHRHLIFDRNGEPARAPVETVKEIFNERGNLNTEEEWVEWQANAYATSLLMPASMIKKAVVKQQQELGIRNRGKIFIDNQACNQKDYFDILSRLSDFFKVSRTAVDYRLRKLELIDDRSRGAQFIGDILGTRGLL